MLSFRFPVRSYINYTEFLFIYFLIFIGLTEHAPLECGAKTSCPHPCRCADKIVDCREKSLTNVPLILPEDTAEL